VCLDAPVGLLGPEVVEAYNSSGATGIPQSLPGEKMATVGPDWATNARTQIIWGLGYLESGGWVTRERDARDRRSILVTIVADRNADMYRHYAGMNSAMDDLCADYDGEQLALIAGREAWADAGAPEVEPERLAVDWSTGIG
ncbi:hypothetical protein ACC691_36485, partial [Rhizobium johnstonii]|uniref:aggregation-promoting factor C-terminal-like domain-containing protein n=1 Tax=Rhizobium johnstonii TaxID=3019933 RepID=UPI003F9C4CF9